MTRTSPAPRAALSPDHLGLLLGFLGVVIFSLSLPMTRIAVQELSPVFVTFGRVALAGLAAVPALLLMRAPLPRRRDLLPLAAVVGGVVLGFPLLMAFAMQTTDASHGSVVMAVLPLLTAVAAALLGGERPRPAFWAWAAFGSAAVLTFALAKSHGDIAVGDILLLLASACAALGYAAGAVMARRMPGLAVIAWALVLSLPIAALVSWLDHPPEPAAVTAWAWGAFVYVALASQFLGFLFWYKGLALGGIARVGQVQLLQTFLTLGFSAALLGERVDLLTIGFAVLTVLIVWLGRRARVDAAAPPRA